MDGHTDGSTERPVDRQTNRPTDRWTYGRANGHTKLLTSMQTVDGMMGAAHGRLSHVTYYITV